MGASETIGGVWRGVQGRLRAVLQDVGPREGMRLVGEALGISEKEVILQEGDVFPAFRREVLEAMVAKRLTGMPLGYVFGYASFWKRDWKVTRETLIPRPDTEILVREALARLVEGGLPFVEVGVGTGCVVGSILADMPGLRAVGTDISVEALLVAHENLREAGVLERCRLVNCDVLGDEAGPFQMVVSNPPYISEVEWCMLDRDVRDFEPETALKAGVDGLDVYRRLAVQAAAKTAQGGWLCVEIGWQQAKAVTSLLQQQDGQVWHEVSTVQDLAGRDRVVCARRK